MLKDEMLTINSTIKVRATPVSQESRQSRNVALKNYLLNSFYSQIRLGVGRNVILVVWEMGQNEMHAL